MNEVRKVIADACGVFLEEKDSSEEDEDEDV